MADQPSGEETVGNVRGWKSLKRTPEELAAQLIRRREAARLERERERVAKQERQESDGESHVSPTVHKLMHEHGFAHDSSIEVPSLDLIDEYLTALKVVEAIDAQEYVPVVIFLADENAHQRVEAAVEEWLGTADVSIFARQEPVIGSWFRRLEARAKTVAQTPVAREALLTATHMADTRLVQTQDAYVTATLLQNVGPVLQALQPTKDAVVRAGALLIVKVEWVVQVHQLTAAQQAILDHEPRLAASPTEIVAALQITTPDMQGAVIPSAGRAVGGDGTIAELDN